VQVRCFNPPRFDSPFGWLSRDHRKTLSVDGEIGFVSGLCVAEMWVGDPKRGTAPWRDTGVQVRGPAVAEIERAFAQVWAMTGEPLPETELRRGQTPTFGADVAVRVVASVPNTAALMRLDQIVAALARERLWLTDAYYAGTTAYVQSLRAAARDGVDVRLLVPNATDIPVLRPLSRTGYRPLLEAGVRVFEWNGTMLHAKTAVADRSFTRIGSSNLNVASWIGNCELDLVVEDEQFAEQMALQYERDLANATEIVLDDHHRMRVPPTASAPSEIVAGVSGSSGRAVAGALRIGNAVGAAFTNRRVLEPVEGHIMTMAGIVLLAIALLGFFLPYVLVAPLALLALWIGCALLVRGWRLNQQRRAQQRAP
jgi:cardiolipin synthase